MEESRRSKLEPSFLQFQMDFADIYAGVRDIRCNEAVGLISRSF